MSAFIDYIIRHSYYKEVNSTYILAKEHHKEAFSLWLQEQTQTIGDDYESKKYVHAHIQEIKRLDNCIRIVNNAIRSSKKSVEWFFHDRGTDSLPILKSKDYELIADNISVIRQYESYIREYSNQVMVQKEAVDRMIGQSLSNHSFEQIRLIATSKSELAKIGEVLKKAHSCEKENPHAWDIYSHGRAFVNIPIDDLKSIDEHDFVTKEYFLTLYNKHRKLMNVIMGEEEHDVSSFSKDVIEKEEDCVFFQMSQSLNVSTYEGKVQIDGKELRRAILDSKRYGTDANFSDDFSIYQFYKLRQEADKLDLKFDTIIARTKDNNDAIKAFNYEQLGKSVVYIDDYIPASTVGTPLYDYIETYKEQKEKRNNARRLASNYPLGFSCHFDSNLNFDSCDFSIILMILNSEQKIVTSEREELEKKKKREEEERKRKEEEEKREKIRRMKACVSDWHITRYGFYHAYLYEYLKTKADREANEYEWDIRHLIWAFKNDPDKQDRKYSYRAALNEIVPKYERKLRDTFGSLLSDMTLVCLPASSSEKNSRRWQEFSKKVCSDLDMWNAYDYIHIEQEAVPRHLGGDGQAVLSFNQSFFNGKYVILCDDIKTTGSSLQRMKYKLESMGATVICSLTIGITVHE